MNMWGKGHGKGKGQVMVGVVNFNGLDFGTSNKVTTFMNCNVIQYRDFFYCAKLFYFTGLV